MQNEFQISTLMKNKKYILISATIFCLLFGIGFFVFSLSPEKKEQQVSSEIIDKDFILRVDKIRDVKLKQQHIKTPKFVRAVYMSSWIASSKKLRSGLVDFIVKSQINAIVLDIKDYSGLIAFEIDNPLIDTYNTDSRRISDIHDFIQELHDKDIYIIGRVTVFQDPLLAKAEPKFAFKRKDNGKTWTDKKGLAFINPQKEEAWKYYTTIAKESYAIGFDEINFDYIRFPSDGDISNLDYALGEKTKLEIMKSFYQFLDSELRTQGIPISADLFGFTASQTGDLTIGQNLDDALPYFDALAPMVYPSHYPASYLGYTNPADHPYEIVNNEMKIANTRAKALGLDSSHLRTWIQDFNMGAEYGFDKVQAQIKASYDAGVHSYMVWDPSNRYTQSAYYENLQNDTTE